MDSIIYPQEKNSMPTVETSSFDYSFVKQSARIAVYDDNLSAPRVIQVAPGPTNEFIETLASNTYSLAQQLGGQIPYTAIREVTENFIHAQFNEIIVSVMDKGNTIRFADQGPGIPSKEKAQLPGFSSATSQMKEYIRGVGSGLPLVKEYLNFSHGKITIDDNLLNGAVVTLSIKEESSAPLKSKNISLPIPPLTEREKLFLAYFHSEKSLGVTDLTNLTEISASTVFNTLRTLEEAGLIEKAEGKKRILTDFGEKVASGLV